MSAARPLALGADWPLRLTFPTKTYIVYSFAPPSISAREEEQDDDSL